MFIVISLVASIDLLIRLQGGWISTDDSDSVSFVVYTEDNGPHLFPWELGVVDR